MNNDAHEFFVITAIKDGEVFYITDIDDDWLSRHAGHAQMIASEDSARVILQEFKFEQEEYDILSDFELGYARATITVEVSV